MGTVGHNVSVVHESRREALTSCCHIDSPSRNFSAEALAKDHILSRSLVFERIDDFVEMGLLMFVNRKIKGKWRRVVRLTDRGRLLVGVLREIP